MKILNHRICDYYNDVFKYTEIKIADAIYEQQLTDKTLPLNSKNFKRIFVHYVVWDIINYIDNSDDKLFFMINHPTPDNFFTEFYGKDKWNRFYLATMKQILNELPICGALYNQNINDVRKLSSGEYNEFLTSINESIKLLKEKNLNKRFSKSRNFIKKYDLEFINNKVFDDLSKRILFF